MKPTANPADKPNTRPPITLARGLNISFRSLHLGVSGVLVGGHVFDVPRQHLFLWLYLTIATGIVMVGLESWPRWRWWHESRGLMTVFKVFLMIWIPWLWPVRVWLLAAVIGIASIGSHMPARYRYYSWIERCLPSYSHDGPST